MTERVDNFNKERSALNDTVMEYAGTVIKRFYSLDSQTYREGVFPKKIKEIMGLVASLVLRCDDCILYHLIRCHEEGVTSDELDEAMSVGIVVGGSITIPHYRRAMRAWDEMKKEKLSPEPSNEEK